MTTTPGPWRFIPPAVQPEGRGYGASSGDPDYDMGAIVGSNNEVVCEFGNDAAYYPNAGIPPSEDDAKLLIAGPMLLDALEALLAEAVSLHETVVYDRATNDVEREEDESIKNARVIIASLRGGK